MKKIDLGCGDQKKEGYIGIDISKESNADIIHNIKTGLPFENESIDEIRAYSVLEHFTTTEFINIMWEIWRVLKIEGICDILIPHGLSETAVKDPTHRLMKDEHIFSYFRPTAIRQIQYSLPPFSTIKNKRENNLIYTIIKKEKLPDNQDIVICQECGRKMIINKK